MIGCFETGRLLARSWTSHFRTHCYFVAGFDMGLATLVLGVRKHLGACRSRSSCFREISIFDVWAPDRASKIGPDLLCYFMRSRDNLVLHQIHCGPEYKPQTYGERSGKVKSISSRGRWKLSLALSSPQLPPLPTYCIYCILEHFFVFDYHGSSVRPTER